MCRGISAVFVLSVGLLAGCAEARVVEPGLANAPALPGSLSLDVHDVIANAHDSCPRARVAARDPLPYRYPACAGSEARSQVVLLGASVPAPAPEPAPSDVLWYIHLDGLPPCEDGKLSASGDAALEVCRRD
jgi:hypothetical protein